jgi:hypothetical protein
VCVSGKRIPRAVAGRVADDIAEFVQVFEIEFDILRRSVGLQAVESATACVFTGLSKAALDSSSARRSAKLAGANDSLKCATSPSVLSGSAPIALVSRTGHVPPEPFKQRMKLSRFTTVTLFDAIL